MDRLSRVSLCILISCIILFEGCLGEKAGASTSVKYVCSDGSIVSESRECRTQEKAGINIQSCPVPAEKVCICNQTYIAPAEKACACNQTCSALAEKTNLPAQHNVSIPVNLALSPGPCESMGCPPDARFVGNSETKKFHTCECGQGARISPKKRVCFTSAKEAESLGFIPCGFCKPSDNPKT
jgi:hypothetical protein